MYDICQMWKSINPSKKWDFEEAKRIFRGVENEIGMKITNYTVEEFYQMMFEI